MRAIYIPEMNEWLTRFRADPEQVRVSFRREAPGWRVTVRSLVRESSVVKRGNLLSEVIEAALEEADRIGITGIDLGMERSYKHPWGALAA